MVIIFNFVTLFERFAQKVSHTRFNKRRCTCIIVHLPIAVLSCVVLCCVVMCYAIRVTYYNTKKE